MPTRAAGQIPGSGDAARRVLGDRDRSPDRPGTDRSGLRVRMGQV